MRVVLASLPLPGHFYPLVPLARACRAAGHRVTVATGPSLEAEVRALDLPLAPISPTTEWAIGVARERYPDLIAKPEPRTSFIAAFFASLIAPAVADELISVLEEERPDLVVHEFYDVGAALAAAAVGVPAVCHGVNRLPPPPMMEEMAARAAACRRGRGAPAPGAPNDLLGAAYLDLCPPSMQDGASLESARRPLPVRPAPWSPDMELPAALRHPRERPRVYATLGTVVNTGERAVRVFRAIVEALGALPVDAVLTVGRDGDPAALGPLPGNVELHRFLPQARLLERVDAVVHHCGAGTMFGSAAAGLPQLGIPLSTDQFISGAPALEASGAGLVLTGDGIAPGPIAAAVGRLVEDDALRGRAAGLRAEVERMPAAVARVGPLEEVARS